MPDVESQTRIQNSILDPIERRVLHWLAERTPQRFTPDTLTIIGIAGSLVIFAGYALTNVSSAFLWLASIGFIINWYGDSLDGTLARFRKIERPKFGFYIDHIVDAFSQVVVFTGLGLSSYARLDIACLALSGYLLLSVLAYVYAFVTGVFRISYAKIGPTEVRVIAIIANTLVFFFGNPVYELIGVEITAFDSLILVIAVLLMTFFLTTSIRYGRSLVGVDSR
jgi:archaetidylinositol phosphate synthase